MDSLLPQSMATDYWSLKSPIVKYFGSGMESVELANRLFAMEIQRPFEIFRCRQVHGPDY